MSMEQAFLQGATGAMLACVFGRGFYRKPDRKGPMTGRLLYVALAGYAAACISQTVASCAPFFLGAGMDVFVSYIRQRKGIRSSRS